MPGELLGDNFLINSSSCGGVVGTNEKWFIFNDKSHLKPP